MHFTWFCTLCGWGASTFTLIQFRISSLFSLPGRFCWVSPVSSQGSHPTSPYLTHVYLSGPACSLVCIWYMQLGTEAVSNCQGTPTAPSLPIPQTWRIAQRKWNSNTTSKWEWPGLNWKLNINSSLAKCRSNFDLSLLHSKGWMDCNMDWMSKLVQQKQRFST